MAKEYVVLKQNFDIDQRLHGHKIQIEGHLAILEINNDLYAEIEAEGQRGKIQIEPDLVCEDVLSLEAGASTIDIGGKLRFCIRDTNIKGEHYRFQFKVDCCFSPVFGTFCYEVIGWQQVDFTVKPAK